MLFTFPIDDGIKDISVQGLYTDRTPAPLIDVIQLDPDLEGFLLEIDTDGSTGRIGLLAIQPNPPLIQFCPVFQLDM